MHAHPKEPRIRACPLPGLECTRARISHTHSTSTFGVAGAGPKGLQVQRGAQNGLLPSLFSLSATLDCATTLSAVICECRHSIPLLDTERRTHLCMQVIHALPNLALFYRDAFVQSHMEPSLKHIIKVKLCAQIDLLTGIDS